MTKITIEITQDGDLGWIFTIRRGVGILTSGIRMSYRDALDAALYHAQKVVL